MVSNKENNRDFLFVIMQLSIFDVRWRNKFLVCFVYS